MRLRGVTCARVVLDVRPNPIWDQRGTTIPLPILPRFRTAWNATCGSSEHACTTTSPPVRAGSSSSPANAGRSIRADGRRAAIPNRSWPSRTNNDGPTPNVTVRLPGARPVASPVSVGGRSAFGAGTPAGPPCVIDAAAAVHARSSSRTSAERSLTTSKVARCSRSWAAVAMPAWCAPQNGTGPSCRRTSGVVALGGHRGARGHAERGPGGPGSDRGEHRPPRQTRRLRAGLVGRRAHAPTTVPATFDRGSASASIVELRVRVSVSFRSVYSTKPLPSR